MLIFTGHILSKITPFFTTLFSPLSLPLIFWLIYFPFSSTLKTKKSLNPIFEFSTVFSGWEWSFLNNLFFSWFFGEFFKWKRWNSREENDAKVPCATPRTHQQLSRSKGFCGLIASTFPLLYSFKLTPAAFPFTNYVLFRLLSFHIRALNQEQRRYPWSFEVSLGRKDGDDEMRIKILSRLQFFFTFFPSFLQQNTLSCLVFPHGLFLLFTRALICFFCFYLSQAWMFHHSILWFPLASSFPQLFSQFLVGLTFPAKFNVNLAFFLTF